MPSTILDIWGQGRVYDGDTVSGFLDADNLNKQGAKITHGPDKGFPVQNLIPVTSDDESTKFPIGDDTYPFITWMDNDETRCFVASEMCRVLKKDGTGQVYLYTPNEMVLSMFTYVAGHSSPRLRGVRKTIGDLPVPFSEISRGKNKSDVVWVFQIAS